MKTVFIPLILILCILLSACDEIEITELNERLIIEAIGIDYEDGVYKVTIEGLDSFTSGSDTNSISSGRLTKCYMFEGETIGMAMNDISRITGQIPLFSQARVLIIGFETAQRRLSEVLDFFRREYTTRTDILIAVAQNKASETVAADFGENVSAGNIIEAGLLSWRHTGKCVHTPLYRFLNSLMGETDSAFCPLITVKKNDFSDKNEIKFKGTAVFRKDGSIFSLTEDETLALMMINNSIENADLTAENDKGLCTFEIIECKTKTRITTDNSKAKIGISVNLRCDIPEFQSRNFTGLSKEDTEKTAQTAAAKTAALLCDVLSKVCFYENCDTFFIGRRINLKNHNFYKNQLLESSSYEDIFEFDINVKIDIRRIGKVTLSED